MEVRQLIIAVSVCIILACLIPVLRDLRRDLFAIRNAVLLLYMLHFGIWPIVMAITEKPRFLQPFSLWERPLLTACFYALLTILLFHAGYYSQIANLFVRRAPRMPASWDWQSARFAWFCLAGLGAGAFLLLMSAMGGLSAYLSDLGTNRTQGLVGRWYLAWGATVLSGLAVVMAYALLVRNRTFLNRLRFYGSVIALFIFGLTIGYRSMAILPMLHVAIWRQYTVKKLKLGVKAFIIITVGITGSVLYSQWREFLTDTQQVAQEVRTSDFWQRFPRLATQRFYGAEVLTVVLEKVPREHPFEWGKNASVEILTGLLPRRLFPQKIEPISLRFGDLFFADYIPLGSGGILTMLPAEAYWNFNVFGFVIAGFFFGVYCRFAYLLIQRSGTISALWLYCFLWELALWTVETPTSAGVILFSHGIPVAAVLIFVARSRSRVRQRGFQRLSGRGTVRAGGIPEVLSPVQ